MSQRYTEALEILDEAFELVDNLKLQAKENQEQDEYDALDSALTYIEKAITELEVANT